MKKFLKSALARWLGALIGVLVAVVIYSATTAGQATLPENVTGLVVTPVQSATTGASNGIADFFAGLEILTEDWRKLLQQPKQAPVWNRKLLKYFIRRYWLQAISDYDLVGRVKFILTACILIGRLPGDFTRNAQLFSKEIENDPDNVEAILDGCYASPALTDSNLLGLLLR